MTSGGRRLRRVLAAAVLVAATAMPAAAADNTSVVGGEEASVAGIEAMAPLPVAEIAPGVFAYQAPYALIAPENRGAIANLGFVIGGDAVAVIDTGGSFAVGAALLAAIRARTDLPVRYVINTHVHPDHLLGNAAFRGPGVAFVGHAKLERALTQRSAFYLEQSHRQLGAADAAATEVVPPDVGVSGTMRLDLGGRTLLLEAHPTAHTDNDLTALDEATSTWFLGDLLFVGHIPTIDGSLLGWIAEMDRLSSRRVAHVVPGHGPLGLGWPEALAPERRYLGRIAEAVRAEIAAGRSMAEAADSVGLEEAEAWALSEEFNRRNVVAAYHELEWE